MIVTADRVTGTIGGGQMEYMAIDRARQMLRRAEDRAQMDIPLGPEIGQCCGGRVLLELDRGAPKAEDLPDALIFGAGHVGRALALRPAAAAGKTAADRQPRGRTGLADPAIPAHLTPLPESLIRSARPGSAVIILTHDHALDFLLAAEALQHSDLSYIGMIGSATSACNSPALPASASF